MSRESVVATNYSKLKILFFIGSVVIVALIALVAFLFFNYLSNKKDRAELMTRPSTSTAVPTPTPILPTVVPTLSQEERTQLADELKEAFPDLPQDAVDEILNGGENVE